jgi:hypothetical protein
MGKMYQKTTKHAILCTLKYSKQLTNITKIFTPRAFKKFRNGIFGMII